MAEFRNPNLQGQGNDGGSGGDSRGMMTFTLLAIALFFVFQYFSKPKQPPAQSQQQAAAPQPAASVSAPAAGSAQQHTVAGQAQPAAPIIAASSVTTTTVENGKLKVVFTNQGAQAEHWILMGKQYLDRPGPEGQPLDLVDANNRALPQSLRDRIKSFGLPLSLFTYEPALTNELNSALYQVSVSGANSAAGVVQAPCTITFHYAANGLDVVKSFSFDKSYVMTAAVEVKRNGAPVRALLAWPGGLGDQTDAMQFAYGKFAWSLDGKDDSRSPNPSGFLFWSSPGVSGGETLTQPYDYAAVNDLYFAAAFLPDAPDRATVVTLHHAIDLPGDSSDSRSQKRPADVIGLAMGDTSGVTRLRLYAGPKALDVLKSIHAIGADGKADGPTLEPLIQLGMWTFIAKPLYLALRALRGMMGPGINNWGWAIIIVTALIKLIFYPLSQASGRSMAKMRAVAPRMKQIQETFKDDREKLGRAMMDLYKREKINPLAGCLPMVVQIPVFISFYWVLVESVEMRQAPFMLWINDLSAHDRFFVLPLLMGAAMFAQFKLNPAPPDPMQAKIMQFMPLVMTAMMAWFPSGLVLYWLTNTVLSILQQWRINQVIKSSG